jgi:3-oxoacyl-ACP reductase-like protein
MKASADVDSASPAAMQRFAQICGWTLARAHARSGVAASIASYLGSGTVFDRAIGDFAIAYAGQNERDYQAFMAAIDSGRIDAHA